MRAHITNVFTQKAKCNTTCKYRDICPLASRCTFQEYNKECDSKLYTHRRHGKNRRKHREFRHKRLTDLVMETLEKTLMEGSKGTIFDPEHLDHNNDFITGFKNLSSNEEVNEDSIEKIRNAFLAVLGDDGSDTE